MNADTIPVAKTPAGGYGDTFPDPILSVCTDPIVDGAPDMRGHRGRSSRCSSTEHRSPSTGSSGVFNASNSAAIG